MKDLKLDLTSLCTKFTNKGLEKCDLYIDNFIIKFDILIHSFNFQNLLIFFLIFILFNFFLNFFKDLNKYIKTFINLNFCFFFLCIIIFPSNIPFTDTWQEIYYLINETYFNYFIQPAAGHFFFGFRFFHIIIHKYFFLNYTLLHVINFIIYFFSCLLLIFYINKFKSNFFLFACLLIIFSGKWINIFVDPVNIAWTINFFLTICFVLLIKYKDCFLKYTGISLILFFALINFGSGIVLIVYSMIYGFFVRKKKVKSFFFIIFSIFLYLIIFKFAKIYLLLDLLEVDFISLLEINFLDLIKVYLALCASIFFPYLLTPMPLLILVGFIQNFTILFLIFVKKKNFLRNIYKFIITNSFLVIGAMGCLLISTIRGDFEAIRYSSYPIFFQIGFAQFVYKQKFDNFSFSNKIIFPFLFFFYLISIIGPNTGIDYAISRSAISQKINKCIENNNDNCNKLAYYETMYQGTWYNYEKFNNVFNYLENNKLSFMRR